MVTRIVCLCILAGIGIADPIFSDTIVVRRVTATPPTLDGLIHEGEWAPAILYDISDTAGRGGTARPPGTIFMYYLYDDSFVYYACDCPLATTRADYDGFAVYMDENNDGLWAPDSSESNHLVEWVGGDSVMYPLLPGGPGPCPGAASVSGLSSGHLQFEARIPIGPRRSDYTVAPGDTVRMFQYTALSPGNRYVGWWPQSLLMSQWADPTRYGPMVFDTAGSGLAARPEVHLPVISANPNPARDHVRFALSDFSLLSSPFSILIYSSSGRLIRSFPAVSGQSSAVSQLTWDCRDAGGAPVPAGTYFFRVSAPTATQSGKVIITR